ncbi:hypothetical protein G4B88_000011 [Cannabis sativa]|uniref:Uncharacterized protein n=1 Tax=Cannabis sativa TaxID=3483 RepID=A0A7J6EPG3_CANSA|nr:hypothetical protein G4B88_000011 [Cannabis sativa]
MRLYGHNDALPNININNLLVMSVHNGTSLDQKFRQRFSRKPTGGNNKPQNLNPRRHPQQPSVVEIKHAISAGRFCDADHKHIGLSPLLHEKPQVQIRRVKSHGGGLLLSVDQQHSFISTLFLVHPTISENQLSKRKKKRCDQDWDRIFERDEKTERYGWSMR